MKTKKILIVVLAVIFAMGLAACGSSSEAYEKHTIAYPSGYDTTSSGASSYDGCDDHFGSDYFKQLDVYNMESTDSLTVIPKFKTYQQTTEYTCGAASIVMVMNSYGKYNAKKYDELTIAKMSGTTETNGVGPDGVTKFFKKIGWTVQRDKAGKYDFDYNTDDNATTKFTEWVQKNLKAEHPIMVDWTDWDGHWQAIIGYDTMGTDDNFGDDVMIMADPYDTTDQYQDGYYTVGAERFFYMWHESSSLNGKPDPQPFVIATPPEK